MVSIEPTDRDSYSCRKFGCRLISDSVFCKSYCLIDYEAGVPKISSHIQLKDSAAVYGRGRLGCDINYRTGPRRNPAIDPMRLRRRAAARRGRNAAAYSQSQELRQQAYGHA